MSPRALTDHEKMLQRERIMTKGKELILTYGIRKVSVDDIVRAAGVAKGTFYNYFKCKESFLICMTQDFHKEIFEDVEQIIRNSTPDTLRSNMGAMLRDFFGHPEAAFFMDNHEELDQLLRAFSADEAVSWRQMELGYFTYVIRLAGMDTNVVKPGVVHNLFHSIYFMYGSELMMQEVMEETLEVQLEGLLDYLFLSDRQRGC